LQYQREPGTVSPDVRIPILFALGAALVASVALGAGDESVTCGPRGIDVTVTLAYDRDDVGSVPGTHVDVGFREPLKLPQPPTPEKLRSRVTSLLSSDYRVAPVKQDRAGVVRVALTTSEAGIPAANAFKLRFDCAAGSQVRRKDLSCTTGEVVDTAGLPMPDTLARQVRCLVVQLDPGGAD
jgi:hypothetical protein